MHPQSRSPSLALTFVVAAAVTLFTAGPAANRAAAHGPIGAFGDRLCGSNIALGCALRATEVVYVTEWGPEGSMPIHRERLSLVGAPTPLDVDNRPGADVTATVEPPLFGQVVLRVSKVVGASASLPLAIVAAGLDPRPNAADGSRGTYRAGYDARRSSAPTTFTETFRPRGDGVAVSVSSSGAASAALLGRRAQEVWHTGQESASDEVRLDFTPLPTKIDTDVSSTDLNGVETTTAELTLGQPSKVDVDYAQTESKPAGVEHLGLTGTLDKLDGATSPARSAKVKLVRTPVAGAQPPDAERTEIDVKTTGARVASGELTLVEKVSGVLASKTNAKLELLPNDSTITLAPQTAGDPQTVKVDPKGQAFTLVDVATAGGEPKRLADDQYAYVYDDGQGLQSTAARIRGLQDATLEIANRPAAREKDLVHVKGTSAGGRFHVLVDDPGEGRKVDADIQNLPRTVDFTFRPKSTPTVRYVGSSDIAKTTVTVHDEQGVAKSVKGKPPFDQEVVAEDLEVVAHDLATDVTASFDPDGKQISLDARDAANCTNPSDRSTCQPDDIGQLDIRLSTGALAGADKTFVDDLNQKGRDGALVRDRTDRYVIFARITSLHTATLELKEPLRVAAKHGPQYGSQAVPKRPFRAELEDQHITVEIDPNTGRFIPVTKGSSTDVLVKDMPGEIDIKLRKAGAPTVEYQGSDQIATVTVRRHDDNPIATSERTGLPAHDLWLEVTDLPKGPVTANLDPAGKNIDLTTDDPIGRIDVQLWTAPAGSTGIALSNNADKQFVADLTINPFGTPIERDGALVRDIADGNGPIDDRYVIFARLTKLTAAKLVLDKRAPDMKLESGTSRDLLVSVAQKPIPECADKDDNDRDGKVDSADPDCAGATDDDETAAVTSIGPNEEIDLFIENRPACMRLALANRAITPACTSGQFTLTVPPSDPACSDTIDNDLDGKFDFPSDPECKTAKDNDETSLDVPFLDPLAILYEGSGATGKIGLSAAGLKKVGKNLSVTLTSLPGRLEAVLVGDRQIDLNTVGGKIGTTQVLLTDQPLNQQPNPADVLPSGEDGVLLRNKSKPGPAGSFVPDRDVLRAELTGLRSAHIVTRPSIEATVDADATPRRPFRFDSRKDLVAKEVAQCRDRLDNDSDGKVDFDADRDGSPGPNRDPECTTHLDHDEAIAGLQSTPYTLFEEFITATLRALQPNTTFKHNDINGPMTIEYSAPGNRVPLGSTPALFFKTNTGVATELLAERIDADGPEFVQVSTDSLPTSVDFCLRSTGAACGVNPFALAQPDGPTIRFQAAGFLTADVLKCDDPGTDGQCTGNPNDDRYLRFNLAAREAAFQFTKLAGGTAGAWLDTDFAPPFDTGLTGSMDLRLPTGVEGTFPAGFGADDFRVVLNPNVPPSVTVTAGQMRCPSGTKVKVVGIDLIPLIQALKLCSP